MRYIKFRAWADEKMYENVGVVGNIVVLEYESNEVWGDVDLEPTYYGIRDGSIKLMQYTGLKDKNGTEIYEGDIVLYKSPFTDSSQLLVIEWSREDACFCFGGIRTDYASNHCEVIGNIYEHNHLLGDNNADD